MTISELLNEIGDENITFQNLTEDLLNVANGKRDSKITFCTSRDIGFDLANAIAAGREPEKTAYIVWMPTEKWKSVLAKAAAELEQELGR